jgi:predicted phage terminase large subunit-like protein
MPEELVIKPQPGPQEIFLSTPADICVYGGSAGGGKSWSLLAEPLRHIGNPHFSGVVLRRTSPQIRNPGGLWDESYRIYAPVGAQPKEHKLEWQFPSGATMQFCHMQYEKDKLGFQGSQIPYIGFDELTHFTRTMFVYMMSRNRSTCGVKPYIRATCNPDATSWVRELIDWWIDPDTGYPIPERSGVVRWFINYQEAFLWADTKEELLEAHPDQDPLSFTFVAATIYDNKILMDADPGYLGKLKALPLIEREQLLGGNWNISEGLGIIKREWIQLYKKLDPDQVLFYVWSLDTAIKEGQEHDYSVAQYWAVCKGGYYLEYQWRGKIPYPVLKKKVSDLFEVMEAQEILIEDKASGQQLIQDFKRDSTYPIIAMMPGRNMGKDKIERMNFASIPAEAGKLFVKEGQPWTRDLIEEWIAFPNAPHDDQVDPMTQFMARRLKKGLTALDPTIGGPVTTNATIGDLHTTFENSYPLFWS